MKLATALSTKVHQHVVKSVAAFLASLPLGVVPRVAPAVREERPRELPQTGLHLQVSLGPFQKCALCFCPWHAGYEGQRCSAARSDFQPHVLHLLGGIVFCDACGLYAQIRGQGLSQSCKRHVASKGADHRLARLRRGIHPKTGIALDMLPVPLLPGDWMVEVQGAFPNC